jgi:hypothetical protein
MGLQKRMLGKVRNSRKGLVSCDYCPFVLSRSFVNGPVAEYVLETFPDIYVKLKYGKV